MACRGINIGFSKFALTWVQLARCLFCKICNDFWQLLVLAGIRCKKRIQFWQMARILIAMKFWVERARQIEPDEKTQTVLIIINSKKKK